MLLLPEALMVSTLSIFRCRKCPVTMTLLDPPVTEMSPPLHVTTSVSFEPVKVSFPPRKTPRGPGRWAPGSIPGR